MATPTGGRGRISRRSLLAGGGLAVAAAAGVATVAVRRDKAPAGTVPRLAETPTPAAQASPTAVPAPAALAGGVARIPVPGAFAFDTFDALRTGEPSVAEVLGRTHSRLLRWDDARPMTLVPDLAARWEQPDGSTLLLHLDPAARWQGLPGIAARPVTAADVVEHLRRARGLAAGVLPGAQSASAAGQFRAVATPHEGVVELRYDTPGGLIFHSLAARFALVQSPEAVAAFDKTWHETRPESVAGSGPFRYEGRGTAGELRFSAHREGHRRPYLDGLRVYEPTFGPSRLLEGEIDSYLARDRRDAAAIRQAAIPAVRESSAAEPSPLLSTLFVGAPPWNNPGLRLALSGALNRTELAKRLFGGSARPWWPIAGDPPADLPGYGTALAEDFKEARQRWEAAGGPGLGTVTVDIPSILDPIYAVSAVVIEMLSEALGAGQFRPAIETYPAISTKVLDGYYGRGRAALWFGWGPAASEPDPTRQLVDWYHSSSATAQANGLAASSLDRLLETLASARPGARDEALAGVARRIAVNAEGGVLPWLVQTPPLFVRDWLETATPAASLVNDHAHTWLNAALASFAQRPSG